VTDRLVRSPTPGRVVRTIGLLLIAGGTLTLAGSLVVHAAARQELAGIGLAVIMTGLMVLLLGNYLRHAAEGADDDPGGDAGPTQPSSVPTTETNDTISPG